MRRFVHTLALFRTLATCASIPAVHVDRCALSRTVKVFGVRLEGKQTSAFIRAARPHLLKLPNTKVVRIGAMGHRVVLLDESLQDEDSLPHSLKSTIAALAGSLTREEIALSYEDLSAPEVLRRLLPSDVQVPTGYEEVGHIIHVNLKPEQRPHRFLIGRVLLDKLSPRIRTVANKADEISSEFRTLPLELIAGDDDFAVAVQHGSAVLAFDYRKVYWSSRLQTEHERIAASFQPDEVVWDLFAGVGPFAVLAAQRGVRVLANDLNPDSCAALVDNVGRNRLHALVQVYNLDAATFARLATSYLAARTCCTSGKSVEVDGEDAFSAARLSSDPKGGDRDVDAAAKGVAKGAEECMPSHILLNLPADAIRFLEGLQPLSALLGAHPTLAAPRVHCYSFSKLDDPEQQLLEAQGRVAESLGLASPPAGLTVRSVRSVAPGKEMLCVEFMLPRVGV